MISILLGAVIAFIVICALCAIGFVVLARQALDSAEEDRRLREE